jgi:hypothetical protein
LSWGTLLCTEACGQHPWQSSTHQIPMATSPSIRLWQQVTNDLFVAWLRTIPNALGMGEEEGRAKSPLVDNCSAHKTLFMIWSPPIFTGWD